LRKNKICVLDEATSNIDIVTEQAIQTLIEESFKDSTMITIAHRINTIIRSDQILVLSDGAFVEFDAPHALMNNPNSHFSSLLKELKEKRKEEAELEAASPAGKRYF